MGVGWGVKLYSLTDLGAMEHFSRRMPRRRCQWL